MQLTPRYLVTNRIDIIANEAGGIVTEYRPVYQRQIQVYKGINNILEFRLLNTDQKPINTSLYTPKFVAFDENKNLVIEKTGDVLDDGSSDTRGLFTVTITENELLDLKQQYISYNIYLIDSSANKLLTYTDSHFGNNGTIKILNSAFPGPRDPVQIANFRQVAENDEIFYISDTVNAEPGINGNSALHTAAIYVNNFTGSIVLQGTLDNQITQQGNTWFDISTHVFAGTETEPVIINFNGVFNFVRFKSDTVPGENITKILIRN